MAPLNAALVKTFNLGYHDYTHASYSIVVLCKNTITKCYNIHTTINILCKHLNHFNCTGNNTDYCMQLSFNSERYHSRIIHNYHTHGARTHAHAHAHAHTHTHTHTNARMYTKFPLSWLPMTTDRCTILIYTTLLCTTTLAHI